MPEVKFQPNIYPDTYSFTYLFGNAADGDFTLESTQLLTADTRYGTLTANCVATDMIINTANYKLFAHKVVVLGSNKLIIRNNGGDGGDGGVSQVYGVGGAFGNPASVIVAGTLITNITTAGIAGGAGINYVYAGNSGETPVAGTLYNRILGAGKNGVKGGDGGSAGTYNAVLAKNGGNASAGTTYKLVGDPLLARMFNSITNTALCSNAWAYPYTNPGGAAGGGLGGYLGMIYSTSIYPVNFINLSVNGGNGADGLSNQNHPLQIQE